MLLSFTSSKGGVGKSTACAAVACELVRLGGRVLIFDLDQNRTLDSWANRTQPPGITVKAINPDDLKTAIAADIEAGRHNHILVDLAGVLDTAIFDAFAVADLVIIPAGVSQPDIRQAFKMADIAARLGVPHRLLLTRVPTLGSKVADYIMGEIVRQNLPRLDSVMTERAAYKEIFAAQPPYLTNDKVAAEVAELVREISQTIKTNKRKAAA